MKTIKEIYDSISSEGKINYDLFLATINFIQKWIIPSEELPDRLTSRNETVLDKLDWRNDASIDVLIKIHHPEEKEAYFAVGYYDYHYKRWETDDEVLKDVVGWREIYD